MGNKKRESLGTERMSDMAGTLRIYTDSASDITPEELKECQVGLIPMSLTCGNDSFVDDQSVSMSQLWERMEAGEILTTSQPSLQNFLDIFEKAQARKESVVYIAISSSLSGTYQTAMAAKTMVSYPDIHIVDGRKAAASVAEKMVVFRACALRDEGKSAEEIAKELTEYRSKVRLFACIDTLEYLVRGGRLSKIAGAVGSVLSIKPLIAFSQEGEVEVIKKVPGLKRAMSALCDVVAAHPIDKRFPVIPIFAKEDANCLEFLSKMAEPLKDFVVDPPQEIGATIGCHIGPGGFGLVYTEAEA